MKTQLVTLALLLCSTGAFAQTLEQSFRNLIAEFKQNPYAYVQANYANDFRFIGGQNGEFRTKDRMLGPTTKVEDIQTTDLKFYESGDLAVVSGINTTRFASSNGGQANTYKDAFTYTFRKLNGQWKHVAMQHTKIDYDTPGQVAADEAAIRKACNDFSEQWDKRNQPGVLAHLADVPYASRYWTNNAYNGSVAIREVVTKAVEASPQPTGIKRQTSNWQLKPLGDTYYWVTFSQAITRPDGTTKYEKEARLLEKMVQPDGSGQWKTVSFITLPMTKGE